MNLTPRLKDNVVGFFIVAPDMFPTILPLAEAWSVAINTLAEDDRVLYNRVHRAADEVALSRVLLSGEDCYCAAPEAIDFVLRSALPNMRESVFSPADCRALAAEIAKLAAKRGEDAVVKQIHGGSKMRTLDATREVYQAMCRAVAEAVRLDAGLVITSLDPHAEARLVEERARRAALDAESKDQKPRTVAEIDEWERECLAIAAEVFGGPAEWMTTTRLRIAEERAEAAAREAAEAAKAEDAAPDGKERPA